MRVVRLLVSVVLAAASLCAHADVVFSPAAPTLADVIIVEVDLIGSCDVSSVTALTGSTIRTTFALVGCHPIPISMPVTVQVGPLPAGSYTYEAYQRVEGGPPEFLGSAELVVTTAPAAVPVPAAGAPALLLLSLALTATALFVMRGFAR